MARLGDIFHLTSLALPRSPTYVGRWGGVVEGGVDDWGEVVTR